MIRADHLGLTSIIRELSLTPVSYNLILHFFRADSWYIGTVRQTWLQLIARLPILYRVDGRAVMVGDGVKQSKEGRFMPGVIKIHQESGNSAKGEYIFGHMFGGLGVIIGGMHNKLYCLLISLKLHCGLEAINGWDGNEKYKEESHVVKMVRDAIEAVRELGPSILLLDRLYLTVPMLIALSTASNLHVVTKAKTNAAAYLDPEPKNGRGAKRKKGEKVLVSSLFRAKAKEFRTVTATLYGKNQSVRYYDTDLLWGNKLYQKLRFVLAVFNGDETILVSTDLTLSPEQIIELYCHRFKIECSFRELKQVVAGFSYRFWSKDMPKLDKFIKNKESQDKLTKIVDENARVNIKLTVGAIERFALLGSIALGLLQIISLLFANTFSDPAVRYLRTKSNTVPSEATVAHFMRKSIFRLLRSFPDLTISRLISSREINISSIDGICA